MRLTIARTRQEVSGMLLVCRGVAHGSRAWPAWIAAVALAALAVPIVVSAVKDPAPMTLLALVGIAAALLFGAVGIAAEAYTTYEIEERGVRKCSPLTLLSWEIEADEVVRLEWQHGAGELFVNSRRVPLSAAARRALGERNLAGNRVDSAVLERRFAGHAAVLAAFVALAAVLMATVFMRRGTIVAPLAVIAAVATTTAVIAARSEKAPRLALYSLIAVLLLASLFLVYYSTPHPS